MTVRHVSPSHMNPTSRRKHLAPKVVFKCIIKLWAVVYMEKLQDATVHGTPALFFRNPKKHTQFETLTIEIQGPFETISKLSAPGGQVLPPLYYARSELHETNFE